MRPKPTTCVKCRKPTTSRFGICARRGTGCIRAWNRERDRRTNYAYHKRYEKTPKGFLMRAYRNMQSRVTGVQWKKAHLYEGLPILRREAFYLWATNSDDFWRLYRQWVAADYEQRLTPSVNRIDTTKGYLLGNMEWMTQSLNSSLANRHRESVKTLERVYALAR